MSPSISSPSICRFITVLTLGLTVGWSIMNAGTDLGPLPEDVYPELGAILVKAISQAPQMLQKNIEVAQNESYVYGARSAMLPQLNSYASYSLNTTAVAANTNVNSSSQGLYYSMGFSQAVYQWGTLKAQTDSAKISVKISEKSYAEVYRLLAVTIRTQYLGLIVKKHAWRNAEFSRKVQDVTLAATEEKLRSGAISSGEIISYRLASEEAHLNEEKAADDFNSSLRFFVHMTGCDDFTADNVPTAMPQVVYRYDAASGNRYIDRFAHSGLEQTFQAQSYKYQIKQADLSYKVAKFRLYPKVSLGGSVSQINQTNVNTGYVSQEGILIKSVSLTANWSIFDGLATRGAKLSAQAQKRYSERLYETYKQTTLDQAMTMARQIDFAARALNIADTRRNLTEASVKRATDELKRGEGSQADVDNAITAFNQTEYIAYSLRADYFSRVAELTSLLGIDPILEKLPPRYLSP